MEFSLAGSVRELVVIAIVGICGVGKTTIFQLLYNDSKVEEHFELRAWAYVSEEFDVLRLCLFRVSDFPENTYFPEMLFSGKENSFKCLVVF